MKRKLVTALFSLLLCSSAVHAAAVKVTNIRVAINKAYRIIFDLSGKTTYHQFQLKSPDRLVIDIANASKAFTPSSSIYTGFPVGNLRYSKKADGALRIVYDLNTPVKVHAFTLAPSGKHGNRIVLDLTPTKKNSELLPLAGAKTTTSNPIAKPIPTKKKATKLRDIVIVIDPGHGGRDPGATGPSGTHEKRVTLSIGLKLRKDLEKIPGIKVYMTRSTDRYPTLSGRLSLARRVKADLFVSVHADAFHKRSARGASVFALSQGRATSEAARWIAERENKSELLGGVDLADKGYMLRSVLVDLSQTATIGLSLKFGSNVVRNLRKFTRMHSPRVEQASLYVLTSPDIPSILVETGFISNPGEERLLKTQSHQRKIAQAIKNGIERYLMDNPIQGTIFTARLFGGKYIVKSGDSLSKIATKFSVSMAKLRQLNDLKKDSVFVGQVIRIPAK